MNIPIYFDVDCPYCIKGKVLLDPNKKTKEENELEYRQLLGTKTVEYTPEDVVTGTCPLCVFNRNFNKNFKCKLCNGKRYINVVKV